LSLAIRVLPSNQPFASRGFETCAALIVVSEEFRRSWPWPPTRLEIIAARMGIDDEELRALPKGAVQRR
jgi:hypothetical protein